jgi:pimeloyl-ACP methyl ester carboxylesterase
MTATQEPRTAARPGLGRLALEQRIVYEMGAFAAASPLLRTLGRGDKHPVLVLPGFSASDLSTGPLRGVIRSQGYWVHAWGLGRNIGPTPEIVTGMVERLQLLHERHDAKVSLIGWSLGGMYARAMARMFPDMVRQVITLGSPYRLRDASSTPIARLFRRYESRHALTADDRAAMPREEDMEPLAMPSTSIYTRTDGIVHWSHCIDAEGPLRENIEVRSSHVGLGVNPAAIIAISDRLARAEGDWKPFVPNRLVRSQFPKPVWWTPDSEK